MIPENGRSEHGLFAGLNAEIAARTGTTPERVLAEYERRKELRELPFVRHHPGEADAIAWAAEFVAGEQVPELIPEASRPLPAGSPATFVYDSDTPPPIPTAEEVARRKSILPLNPTREQMAAVVGPSDPPPPMQDADGWISAAYDAWERRNFPWRSKGFPTVGEFRQELRALDRDPAKCATAPTEIDADEIVRKLTGGR